MALNLHLRGTGPGRALIDIKGVEVPADQLDVAIQRGSDEAYIGNEGAWQPAPVWHRLQPGSDAEAGRFITGPEIVDALVEVARSDSFQGQLRWEGGAAKGTLRIRGELNGSSAERLLYLKGTDPGWALIEFKGEPPPKSELSIAIQRTTDKKYIGNDDAWQHERAWHHLQPSSDKETGRFVAGPVIVDALIEAGYTCSFQAELRWKDIEENDVEAKAELRISGELKRSPSKPPDPDPNTSGNETNTTRPVVQDQRRPRWPWIAGLAGLLAVSALVAWLLWPQPADQDPDSTVPPDPEIAEQSEDPTTGESDPTEVSGEEPESALHDPLDQEPEPDFWGDPELEPETEPELEDYAGLSGGDYVQKVVREDPPATIILEHAKSRARLGDCDALVLLYKYAAEGNPEIAAEVARLYDPQGFDRSPCIIEPSLDIAREYYVLAAESGIPHAQRRLGQILIEGRVSGPEYDDGKMWLEEAAVAGDAEAERILDERPTPGETQHRTFENR